MDIDFDNTTLLVSDSNERSEQYDSKQLAYSRLVELAQDNLFKKQLDFMSKYMTVNQYNAYVELLNKKQGLESEMWYRLKNLKQNQKFKAVPGQIIILRAENVPQNTTPLDYLKEHWEIPQGCVPTQVKQCLLRGITYNNQDRDDVSQDNNPIKRATNENVVLYENNMPPHMHHSGITKGGTVPCMFSHEVDQNSSKLVNGSIGYDMFKNDSIGTGLDKNELEGVDYQFVVQPYGTNSSSNENIKSIIHNNMPVCDNFYVFEIQKND